jgi:hypothetical protein
MDRLVFFAGRPHGFAINGDVCMREIPSLGLQAAWLVCTALLGFPASKEGRQLLVQLLSIKSIEDPFIGHLARHCRSLEPKASSKLIGSQTDPLGGSFEAGLSCHLCQT